MKSYIAELIGTALLVIGGCGAALFGSVAVGGVGVAIAFGLSLTVIAFMIGHISGAHVNPAVTVALALSNKFSWNKVPGYISSQLLGAAIGSLILYMIAKGITGFNLDESTFASNIVNPAVSDLSALLIEIVLTSVLCLTVLATTRSSFTGSGAVAVGVALALVHMISIPMTNTSVNPARSFGPALIAQGEALKDLWIFVVGPMAGAVIAYIIHVFAFGRDYHHHNQVEQ